MRARMVPFDGLVPRLRRVVRQAGMDTGKQVHLTLEGTHGELDRNVLDRMVAPLEHMLRNSVAHGTEAPEQRRAAGKPEEGEIAIRLHREGSEIVRKWPMTALAWTAKRSAAAQSTAACWPPMRSRTSRNWTTSSSRQASPPPTRSASWPAVAWAWTWCATKCASWVARSISSQCVGRACASPCACRRRWRSPGGVRADRRNHLRSAGGLGQWYRPPVARALRGC